MTATNQVPEPTADPNGCTRRRQRTQNATRPLSDYPELMTVAEAAGYLRIATSTAYTLAKLHLAGHPQACMPAMRVGGCIRIVRAQLANGLSSDD